MLEKAKQLASQEFSRLSGREIKAEDCFVVWFSKTLQNWKALVSTNAITSSEPCGNYAEITHNGDKKEIMWMFTPKFQIVPLKIRR
ncbi:gp37 [Streptococcus pneumoniae]|nr:gp37 [Streptococcus pneumoniae]